MNPFVSRFVSDRELSLVPWGQGLTVRLPCHTGLGRQERRMTELYILIPVLMVGL